MFPVPWRLLEQDQRFRKYQWVEATATKSNADSRRESYRLRPDGIRVVSPVLSTSHGWKARKDFVLPLRSHSLCELERQRSEKQFPTLGFFKPAGIKRLRIAPDTPEWSDAQKAMLRQSHLFVDSPMQELEKIPYKFIYEFTCDDPDCNGHNLMCTDWEMGQSYRQWISTYGPNEWEEKFRERYEFEMIHQRDTHFYVGTVASHPHRWIIIGLFYPPLPDDPRQASLFLT